MFGRNQMSSEWAFYTNPKALLEQNSTGTRSSWSFFGLNDVWGCLRFGWCQWLKSQEVDHGRASTFGWCFMMFVPQIVCHAGKSWNQPQHSPPFRWRHSGGLLDSTMWSTSRSSALRPGILMNRKLWVVGPESWKDLNFCHYPGRGSGVQVMLLCLFFAKRGEALSESWVSSNCDYYYGFIQCLSSFWYQQNSFFWVCRCTCTPNVHRMYTVYGYESIPINTIFRGMHIHLPAILGFTRGTRVLTHCHITCLTIPLKHSQEAPEWKPEDRRSGGVRCSVAADVQRGVPWRSWSSLYENMFWSLWNPMFEAGRCVRLGI